MSEKKRISVYLNKKLQKTLLIASWARTPSEAIHTVADRYHYIISQEIEEFKKTFTHEELEFIAYVGQIVKDPLLEDVSGQLLFDIEDCSDFILKSVGVSRLQIIRKLCKLSDLQQIALFEYIEEYWFEVRDVTKLEKELQDNKIEEEVVDVNVHSAVAALLNKIRKNALMNSII